MTAIGIVLERPSGPDRAHGKMLAGEIGQLLIKTFEFYGVDVRRDCTVTYAVPEGSPQGDRIALVKPQVERIQTELAHCSKILACGAMAMAAAWPLQAVPTKYHRVRGQGVLSNWGNPHKYMVPTYSLQQVWSASEYGRDLYWDIQKIITQDAPHPEPQIKTVIVQTVTEARYWLDQLCGASVIAADIESDGLDPLQHKISSIGFGVMYRDNGCAGLAVIIPRHLLYPRSQYLSGLLLYYLGPRSPWTGTLVWQNAVFDLQHLREYLDDWPFHPHLADTLLMNYALDERPIGRFGIHSLKDMARIRFDCHYGFDWATFLPLPEDARPYDDLYRYNGVDCFYTARLYEIFREEMHQEPGLDTLVDGLLIPATKALAQVARKGLLIDQDYLRSYRCDLDRKIAEREQALKEFAAANGAPDFVPSSSQQVAQFLFGTLGLRMPKVKMKDRKPGAWSTAKIVLDKVRKDCTEDQRTFIDNLLAYRLYEKTRSTYVDALLEKVSVDGRIHPNLALAGTATGRLASWGPNMQNQPVHTAKELRRAIIAPDGYSLVEVDYSALEVRVFAWFSQEPTLVDAFRRGADVHREVAARFFNKNPEDVSPHERYICKSIVFGILYQRSAEAIAEGREMDLLVEMGGNRWDIKQTEQFMDAFLMSMPRVKQWVEQHKNESFAQKYTLTPFGRRRRFPLVTPYQRGEVERQIINTPIQSVASDICLSSAVRLMETPRDGRDVILLVHDSILFQIRNDLIPADIQKIKTVMECPPLEDRGVPWATSVKIGRNWGDMEDYNG